MEPSDVSLSLDIERLLDEEAAPDFSLRWIDPEPRRGVPRRLGTRNLFLLACREAYADGKVDHQERRTLGVLARALGMARGVARGLLRTAEEDRRAGRLRSRRPLCPRRLLSKACQLAAASGEVDDRELRLLTSLARQAGVTPREVHERLARLTRRAATAPPRTHVDFGGVDASAA